MDVGTHNRCDLLNIITNEQLDDGTPVRCPLPEIAQVLKFIENAKSNSKQGCETCRGDIKRIRAELGKKAK